MIETVQGCLLWHLICAEVMWTKRGKVCLKIWPIDPLGLRNIQLEVSEKLPQG